MNCQPASDGARLSYSGMRCRGIFGRIPRDRIAPLVPDLLLSTRYSDQLRC